VAHTQVTDHRILRLRSLSAQLLRNVDDPPSKPRLVPFPATSPSDARDLALAWQSLVGSGMTSAEHEAERMVRLALKESPNDPSLLGALGYIEQKHGNVNNARELYQKVLTIDPNSIDVATNLGVLEAREGHLREAVKLWNGAFLHAPGRSGIGMNLAKAFCATGQIDQARTFALRVLEFDPDLADAKELLKHLNRTPPGCLP
jgi:Flp pilus assembly protein TadD